jgi:cytochrome c6
MRRKTMKRGLVLVLALTIVCLFVTTAFVKLSAANEKGEALFKQHCAICHVDGGNIINPQKTLHKKDRDANNIKSAADIIKTMRNPGPGMTQFDAKTIPDKDAGEIAEHILKSYK